MDVLHAIIYGIVEGITEFLPISSTGHLILAARVMDDPETDFMKTFQIAIQFGAILSVVVLYARTLLLDRAVLLRVGAAFLPTATIGYVLYRIIKQHLIGDHRIVLWSLFLGGIFLVVFELLHREDKEATDDVRAISFPQAFAIGLFQSIAVVPGVSRAAATIVGGLILGIRRRAIVEFSFLLAVPTMLAACGYDVYKNAPTFSGDECWFLAVGFVVSFLVAAASIKFLLYYIRQHNFIPFGVYRIVAAAAFFFLVLVPQR